MEVYLELVIFVLGLITRSFGQMYLLNLLSKLQVENAKLMRLLRGMCLILKVVMTLILTCFQIVLKIQL